MKTTFYTKSVFRTKKTCLLDDFAWYRFNDFFRIQKNNIDMGFCMEVLMETAAP